MKEFKSKIKQLLEGGDKTLKNIVFFFMIGLILVFVSDFIFDTKKENPKINNSEMIETISFENKNKNNYLNNLEQKLQKILSTIDGVGKLDVMVTLDYSKEIILAKNTKKDNSTTKENDTKGGLRTITDSKEEYNIVYSREQNNSGPVVIKEKEPVIKGVLVIAEGANDIKVKNNIIRSCQTLFGLPMNRVCVNERKNRE